MTTPGLEQDPNIFQRVASTTHDIATPANAIDAVAFGVAMRYIPELDTPKGIGMVAGSFIADLVDGLVARATGTDTELGAKVDAGGDKVKIAFAIYHIARKGLASPLLLTTVGAYNIANAGAFIYDSKNHKESQIEEVSKDGKLGVFSGCLGVGLQVIGTALEKSDRPTAGKAIKASGAAVAYGGIAKWGIPATKGYWTKALGDSSPRL